MKNNKKVLVFIGVFVSILLLSSLLLISFSKKSDKYEGFKSVYEARYIDANDGDTARFIIDNQNVKCRFIAIDTPEIDKDEPFSKEARDYVRDRLEKANKIILCTDLNSDEYDKYERLIVWVFVDDELLQKELVEKGYAKVKYIYGDYRFVDELNNLQDAAKKIKIGIWSIKK